MSLKTDKYAIFTRSEHEMKVTGPCHMFTINAAYYVGLLGRQFCKQQSLPTTSSLPSAFERAIICPC